MATADLFLLSPGEASCVCIPVLAALVPGVCWRSGWALQGRQELCSRPRVGMLGCQHFARVSKARGCLRLRPGETLVHCSEVELFLHRYLFADIRWRDQEG